MDEKIVEKLKGIQGQELKYKKLCEALDLPIKTSDSKKAQFNNLSMYCNIQTLEHPKRYVVTEVYEEELALLGLLNSNNKYQLMFELAVYQAFLNNNGQPIYLSNMDSLRLFQEINENFSYACNNDIMMMVGDEYSYMPNMGLTIYRILNQWTQRRLNTMKNRHAIIIRDCYRLYKRKYVNGREYIETFNVPIESEYEKYCQEIYNQAIEEIMPEDWGDEGKGRYWVNRVQWYQFEERIKTLVKDKFDEQFDNLKPIIMISCPTTEWLENKIRMLYKELKPLQAINEESCRKVMETKAKSMDDITQGQRKEFIEINMKPNPKIKFKDILKKAYEGQ